MLLDHLAAKIKHKFVKRLQIFNGGAFELVQAFQRDLIKRKLKSIAKDFFIGKKNDLSSILKVF
jgi:hypothetical protein